MNKIQEFFVNIHKMHIGKKIYSLLWLLTGGFLIAVIALFVIDKDAVSEKTEFHHYTITNDQNAKVTTDIADYSVKVKKEYKKDATDYKVNTFVKIEEAAKIYDFTTYFDFNTIKISNGNELTIGDKKDLGKALFTIDSSKPLDSNGKELALTSDAKHAQNVVAAVSATFLVIMIGAVMSTTIVSKHLKSKKSKTKRGGKK